MEKLAAERCISIDRWLETAASYEDKGDLDLARECLLVYHYLSKKNETSGENSSHTSISTELENIEMKILLRASKKIPSHHTLLFFPSILSVDPLIPGLYLPGQLINTVKPIATATCLEVDTIQDNYLSCFCGMCGKFCVTTSPTVRIPGVSILLGRRIACQYNCGITYCSDLCYLQHSALHGDLCQILPEFFQHISELGLCKYRGLLGLKTLASGPAKLKFLLENKIEVKRLDIPILGELSQLLFKVTNKNSEIIYTRQEIIQLFTIIYSKSIVCNISDIPIDLPFFSLLKCKIWVFSPKLMEYITDLSNFNGNENELFTSWKNGKVYLRCSNETQAEGAKFYIRNYELDFENKTESKKSDYRCRFCIVGFCKTDKCQSCGNYNFDEAVDPNSNDGIEDDLMFLMSKFGYDSTKLFENLLSYIDSKQLGPFSYSKNIIKFLIRSALCLFNRTSNFEMQFLSHIMGKLSKLMSMDKFDTNLMHISTLAAYSYNKVHGNNCLGVVEMRQIASACNVNWINHPLKFNVSDSSLLDIIVKKIYGPSTFTPFPPDCHSSIVNLAFAASRTRVATVDPLFGVVKDFVLEFEKLGVLHFPTGLTPLGLALMARNDSLLNALVDSDKGLNSNETGKNALNTFCINHSECKYYFDKTPTPLIIAIIKFEMDSSDSKHSFMSTHLHKLINLLNNKKDFVESRTSEIEGLDAPIHYAAWTGNLALVKLLIKYGAIANPLSGLGLTPLDLASSAGHLDLVKYFVENIKTTVSPNSIFLACCSLRVDTVKYLLEACNISLDGLPGYFGLVWHGIAFSVCQTSHCFGDLGRDVISRLNDAASVVKLLCEWGLKTAGVLDGKLPSEAVKSLSLKFLEEVSLSHDQIHYASVARAFVYLGQLFENIEKNL